MKKAKLMLAAIAVFAVVGGVYATKAEKRGAFVYCGLPNALPTTTITNATIAPSGVKNTYCTLSTNSTVVYTRTTFLQ
jgi:hypothetical protein